MTATTTWRFGRKNDFADAPRRIERNAAATRGGARSVLGPLSTVLLFGTLLFISSAATSAADMRGDQFITVMDGNMLSGTDAAGAPFNRVSGSAVTIAMPEPLPQRARYA